MMIFWIWACLLCPSLCLWVSFWLLMILILISLICLLNDELSSSESFVWICWILWNGLDIVGKLIGKGFFWFDVLVLTGFERAILFFVICWLLKLSFDRLQACVLCCLTGLNRFEALGLCLRFRKAGGLCLAGSLNVLQDAGLCCLKSGYRLGFDLWVRFSFVWPWVL